MPFDTARFRLYTVRVYYAFDTIPPDLMLFKKSSSPTIANFSLLRYGENIKAIIEGLPLFAWPSTFGFCFRLIFLSLANEGAGSVGLPEPRCFLRTSAAVAVCACDCCITLNSLTTSWKSVSAKFYRKGISHLPVVLLFVVHVHSRLPNHR